jgi:hypothetical protein
MAEIVVTWVGIQSRGLRRIVGEITLPGSEFTSFDPKSVFVPSAIRSNTPLGDPSLFWLLALSPRDCPSVHSRSRVFVHPLRRVRVSEWAPAHLINQNLLRQREDDSIQLF